MQTEERKVIIVSGKICVDAPERDACLDACRQVIELARSAPGCVDFHLSGDALEPDRINVFEQWDSVSDVEAFRGSGPPSDQTAAIRDAQVFQHGIARRNSSNVAHGGDP